MYDERQWYQLTYLLIQLLIRRSSLSLSSSHQDGKSALFYATLFGHMDTVKLLLDSGSDIGDKDNVSQEDV